MKTFAAAVGASIRRHREAQGLSQERLAEISGMHRTYISGVERGVRNLTIESLYRIANALQRQASLILKDAEAGMKR